MKKKTKRFGYTMIALFLGILLVFFFTVVGDQSKGPLEDLFVKLGYTIDNWDDKYITKRSSKKRAKSMQWFEKYRSNSDSLNHPQKILLGAFDNNTLESFQSILDIEEKINNKLPLIHIYSAWGSKPEQRFPLQKVNAIYRLGSVPVLTWEPWLNDFDKEKHPSLKEESLRDRNGMADVAAGVYDFYLETWVEDLKTFGKPIYIRLGHEMNDPYRYSWGPQNNTPEDFVRAWKHVVDLFKKEGADQVIWIWSPHIAYGHFDEYYPGEEYADWIGVGALNYGEAATWSKWWTFDEIFGNYYEALKVFDKPVMLTEFGSLSVGGDRAAWYADALCDLSQNYPMTRSVIFFHYDNDYTLTNKSLNWYFVSDSLVVESIANCIAGWEGSVQ